jgi:NAD+ synthase
MLPKIDSKIVKQEIIDFIKDLHDKTGTDGFVVGLSGGIDSTVVAYLLKEAVGKDKIYSYHLNSSTTPKEDIEHARLVAKLLDISYREIAIDSITEEFLNITSSSLDNDSKMSKIDSNDVKDISQIKAAEGNVKARIRMVILYYFANLKNCLVAGTGNKSELLIGYFTKYGDGACDFETIGDIYKTQLRILAKDWNIPNEIIEKPPRAGLWLDQTDENEIGLTYDILDELLYLIVDEKLSNDGILMKMNISSSEIDSVRKKIANNKHKLQFPPSPFEDKKLF